MTIDADRLSALRRAKLTALVRADGVPDPSAEAEAFPDGAVLSDPDRSTMRLSFVTHSPEVIGEAISRLGEVLERRAQLLGRG